MLGSLWGAAARWLRDGSDVAKYGIVAWIAARGTPWRGLGGAG